MPANMEHCECLDQLEDDVVNFLPSVADIDVFGCEVDLVRLDTHQPLWDPTVSKLPCESATNFRQSSDDFDEELRKGLH